MEFNFNKHIEEFVDLYLQQFPGEKTKLETLQTQLKLKENLGSRKNFNGHITASAFIFDPDYSKILMIKNRHLNKWLAPGGHWESKDDEIYNSALREGVEETGLEDLEFDNWHFNNNMIPIDIDTHQIPSNKEKGEDDHYHHDFRYIFVANGLQEIDLSDEAIVGVKWINLDDDLPQQLESGLAEKIGELIINEDY